MSAAGFDDVARAYLVYRQHRAELRATKALLGVRDELKLSLAGVTVLSERYLLRDEWGRPAESTGELMDRTAHYVAMAEDQYRGRSSAQWADRFSALLRGLEFLPNSPTLVNAGTPVGLLSACVVLPLEDSLRSIFLDDSEQAVGLAAPLPNRHWPKSTPRSAAVASVMPASSDLKATVR